MVALVGKGSFVPPGMVGHPPLLAYLGTRPFDLPATLIFLVAPALLVMGWAARELRYRRWDAALWAAALNALLVLWLPPKTTYILWHSGRLATGFVAATLLAAPLAASAPRVWRALAVLFAASVAWTVAVTLRYLFWDAGP